VSSKTALLATMLKFPEEAPLAIHSSDGRQLAIMFTNVPVEPTTVRSAPLGPETKSQSDRPQDQRKQCDRQIAGSMYRSPAQPHSIPYSHCIVTAVK
jgi:hypothetical protein